MKISHNLPLEFELALVKTLIKSYPCNCYNLEAKYQSDEIIVDVNFDIPAIRSFSLQYVYGFGKGALFVSAWWNGILSFCLDPKSTSQYWIDEDGVRIPRPYLDGEELEDIAAALYSAFQKYFPGELPGDRP